MCLSIAVYRPEKVLEKGTHLGYEWVITHNGSGYRCGYLRVDPNHPWYGLHYNDVNLETHGGLTFSEADVSCGKGEDNGWWFGFDCGHAWDLPDPNLEWEFQPSLGYFPKDAEIRTQDYVRENCLSMCQQASKAYLSLENGSKL